MDTRSAVVWRLNEAMPTSNFKYAVAFVVVEEGEEEEVKEKEEEWKNHRVKSKYIIFNANGRWSYTHYMTYKCICLSLLLVFGRYIRYLFL